MVTKDTIYRQNVILKERVSTLINAEKKSKMNINRQETLKKAASTHRNSLRKSLEHRLEVARANGNEQLVRQLESEANYLQMK